MELKDYLDPTNTNYVPWYQDDADYNTNSKSFSDALARDKKFLKLFTDEIIRLNNNLVNEFGDFKNLTTTQIKQFNDRLDGIKEEMKIFFNQWLADGVLDEIINQDILNSKADKIDVDNTKRVINVKNYGVKGDGVTDNTTIIQELIDRTIREKAHLYFPNGNYVISQGLTINYRSDDSFKIEGENSHSVIFSSKLLSGKVIKVETINDGLTNKNVSIGDFTIKPFNSDYNSKSTGLELVNTVGTFFSTIKISNLKEGLVLTTHSDTSINENNTGYNEANTFENFVIDNCLKALSFRAGDNDTYNTSFHGNNFNNFLIAINDDVGESTALNIESGYLYNCRFDIRVFIKGSNSNLIYLNTNNASNYGNITYEIFGTEKPNAVKTGDNASASFFFNGFIYGHNGGSSLSWSLYKPIQSTDYYYSNTNPVIKTLISPTSEKIGQEKFYSLNLVPEKDMKKIAIDNKNGKVMSILNSLSDLWEGTLNGFFRYKNVGGTVENSYILASKDQATHSRLILGTVPVSKGSTENDFIPGFELKMNGSTITSKPKNSILAFDIDNITRNGQTIHDSGTVKSNVLANNRASGSIKTPIYTGDSRKGFRVEKWGLVPVTAIGDVKTTIEATGEFSHLYQVLTSFETNGLTALPNYTASRILSNDRFEILGSTENTGNIFWRAYGIVYE